MKKVINLPNKAGSVLLYLQVDRLVLPGFLVNKHLTAFPTARGRPVRQDELGDELGLFMLACTAVTATAVTATVI